LAGTAVATGVAVVGGIQVVGVATKAALISAAGIIALTLIVIGIYIGLIFLVAPILSTLVQLDSVEKVDYSQYAPPITSSGDCTWPTTGHYSIITGPNGGTHYRSRLEAIDIGAPGGSPHLSATSGVVVFTGVYANYGNTVKVQTQNDAGSFLAVYGHLSEIGVSVGEKVSQGKQIGIVGGSGGWTPHIHMEWQGIKYNQCPAGGLIIKEGCCFPYPGGVCTGLCNAFSN
jgi:murein DD-endopeptidase MepM/ murein hydrolase activator NlpD